MPGVALSRSGKRYRLGGRAVCAIAPECNVEVGPLVHETTISKSKGKMLGQIGVRAAVNESGPGLFGTHLPALPLKLQFRSGGCRAAGRPVP